MTSCVYDPLEGILSGESTSLTLTLRKTFPQKVTTNASSINRFALASIPSCFRASIVTIIASLCFSLHRESVVGRSDGERGIFSLDIINVDEI